MTASGTTQPMTATAAVANDTIGTRLEELLKQLSAIREQATNVSQRLWPTDAKEPSVQGEQPPPTDIAGLVDACRHEAAAVCAQISAVQSHI